jgi:hypothetical protein
MEMDVWYEVLVREIAEAERLENHLVAQAALEREAAEEARDGEECETEAAA